MHDEQQTFSKHSGRKRTLLGIPFWKLHFRWPWNKSISRNSGLCGNWNTGCNTQKVLGQQVTACGRTSTVQRNSEWRWFLRHAWLKVIRDLTVGIRTQCVSCCQFYWSWFCLLNIVLILGWGVWLFSTHLWQSLLRLLEPFFDISSSPMLSFFWWDSADKISI